MRQRLSGYALAAALVLGSVAIVFAPLEAGAQSTGPGARSSPPDTTNYSRPLVADDHKLQPHALTAFVRDAVVSNTNAGLALTDTFNDGEPSIAVNPSNPNDIAITAFSGFWGTTSPLWHSVDGGATWTKRFTIPAPPGALGVAGCPCDQTIDYGPSNMLWGTFLLEGTMGTVVSASTSNPDVTSALQWFSPGGITQLTNLSSADADQPWMLVNRDPFNPAQQNMYVAYDDFLPFNPVLHVAVSTGPNPPNFARDAIDGTTLNLTNGVSHINPGHRLAADRRNGTMYAVFQQSTGNGAGGSHNINYMLNRSTDGGQTWSLNGNSSGILVANADSTQPTPKFGTVNALLGGVDHAAVDPTNGDVYVVFGSREAATGNNRLGIVRLTTDGSGTISQAFKGFVTGQVQAALPSVAVNSAGAVGVLYDTFDGVSNSGFPVFTAHLATSFDHGQTFTTKDLLTFNSPAVDSCPSTNCLRQRVLGDYQQLKTVGTTFYGAFTGNGAAMGRTISNNDPMFVKVTQSVTQTIAPQRLADTRQTTGPIQNGQSACFPIAGQGGIPADATAVVLNVTATSQTTNGWLTIYPNGQPVPTTSTLNFAPSEYAMANGTIARVGNGGQVCVNVGTVGNAPGGSNVILDATGFLTAESLAAEPMLSSPVRIADTRSAGGSIPTGQSRCFPVAGQMGIPQDAAAVVLNVTAVGYGTKGWLTAYPNGQPLPQTSTLNFDTSEYAIANGTLMQIGSNGQVCVNVGTLNGAAGSSDVVLDATGYVAGSAASVVATIPPVRLVDTRNSGGPVPGATSQCFTLAGQGGIPLNATSVLLNVTAVGYGTQGWLTAYPAGQSVPTTSTLNFDTTEYAMANGATIQLGTNGQVCVNVGTVNSVPGSANIVLDAVGYVSP